MHIFGRLLFIALILLPAQASAKWPERTVTLVVPFAAGGITDLLARMTAQRLSAVFEQSFIVENVVGAAGTIATEKVARAAPDGYTLLFATITQISVAPFLNKITYDPIRDFKPVAIVGTSPFVITVSADFPANTLEEFVAHVKSNSGRLTYGTAGAGSLSHLSAAVFLKRAGIDMIMVPYKGLAPAFSDLLGGTVNMVSATPVELKPFFEAKKLKFIASSGSGRSRMMPGVPTIAEAYAGHDIETWNGIVAPTGTPQDIINKIADAVLTANNDPSFIQRLETLGVDPSRATRDEFSAIIRKDMDLWRNRVSEMGLTIQ